MMVQKLHLSRLNNLKPLPKHCQDQGAQPAIYVKYTLKSSFFATPGHQTNTKIEHRTSQFGHKHDMFWKMNELVDTHLVLKNAWRIAHKSFSIHRIVWIKSPNNALLLSEMLYISKAPTASPAMLAS